MSFLMPNTWHASAQLHVGPRHNRIQPYVGSGMHPAQLYIGLWGVRAQSPVGSGTQSHPTPY
jgi:outer membrane protein W